MKRFFDKFYTLFHPLWLFNYLHWTSFGCDECFRFFCFIFSSILIIKQIHRRNKHRRIFSTKTIPKIGIFTTNLFSPKKHHEINQVIQSWNQINGKIIAETFADKVTKIPSVIPIWWKLSSWGLEKYFWCSGFCDETESKRLRMWSRIETPQNCRQWIKWASEMCAKV